jgi:quercetin dioxygenase-like cupin family protein
MGECRLSEGRGYTRRDVPEGHKRGIPMKTGTAFVLMFVAGIGLVGCGQTAGGSEPLPSNAKSSAVATPATPSPPKEIKLENIMEKALDKKFAPGREVIVSYVEIPPNTTLERHWHPGEEFHYYLEGEVEIAIDGQPSIIGTPGKVGHVPYKAMHTAKTKDKGAKIVVFRVHTTGKPVRYLEGGGTAAK